MVLSLQFLVMKIHSEDCLELLVLPSRKRSMLILVLDLSSLLVAKVIRSPGRLLRRPSFSRCVVAQLRDMLRIGSAQATLRLRKRLLLLLMLLSDSAHGGDLMVRLTLEDSVRLRISSSIMFPEVEHLNSTHLMKVMSGLDIVHHPVMLTPYMVRSADPHLFRVYLKIARLMFMDIMVMIEIQELLDHSLHLIVAL